MARDERFVADISCHIGGSGSCIPLCAVLFAGVFSSGCGVLGEWRDVFTGQEPVETVNNDFKPEVAPEPKEEPKVDTPKELTDTTKTEEPDSITVKAPENENP